MEDINCDDVQHLSQCRRELKAIQDTMDILSGKWKISIMSCLRFGKKRFMDLQREVEGIGPKMLSKELQDLEMNALVKRNVLNTKPVIIEYEITAYGQTLNPIIHEMSSWGMQHRKKILST
jgi:DNA-binding HxlR family transcriptional regulator